MSDVPDYRKLDELLQRNDAGIDPAELHGALCAHLATARQPTPESWLEAAFADRHASEGFDDETREALDEVYRWTADGIADPEFGFRVYLPQDERSLSRRTRALATWATGFLGGLGTASPGNLERLQGEAGEFVRDLSEIARADFDIEDPNDSDERAFYELVEYARVGAMLIFETFRGPDGDDAVH